MRHIKIICIILLLVCLIGCQNIETSEPVTLTINYPSSDIFYKRFGHAFEQKYPHISIRVVHSELNEISSNDLPDIVFLTKEPKYKELSGAGYLSELNYYIQRDHLDLDRLSANIVNILSLKANNKLYGLSPTFDSTALYYNIDLFERYGVPFPENNMSWEELFQLAMRFPSVKDDGSKLYGFTTMYYNYIPFSTLLRIGQTEGLSFINPDDLKVNINTEDWRKNAEFVIEAFKQGAVYNISEGQGEFSYPPILTGDSAMELGSYSTAYNFEIYANNNQMDPIHWGVVTAPVDSDFPNYSDFYKVNEIFGISDSSPYKDEAWEFIKFITYDLDYYYSNPENLIQYGLPVRSDLIKGIQGKDISPLYMLEASPYSYNPYDEVHHTIINEFKRVGQKHLDDVIKGSLTIEEAFEQIEEEGQQAVYEAHEMLLQSEIASDKKLVK